MKAIFTSLFVLCYAALFAQAGALDPSFNGNGKYRDTRVFYRYSKALFEKVAIQPDGKIIVAGTYTAINISESKVFLERLNADGTQDVSFGDNGIVKLNYAGYVFAQTSDDLGGIAVQPDGKILVAGSFIIDGFPPFDSVTKTTN